MNITYIGHSCFLLEHENYKILTDPFPPFLCSRPSLYEKAVDFVTISHSHFDHCYIENLDCENILTTSGVFRYDNLIIESFLCYHDSFNGLLRGNNLIFMFRFKDLNICHLGDIGHELDDDLIDKLGQIDILFIPVGGNITIDGKTASTICMKLNPKIIIPMHYKTHNKSLPIDSLENFLLSIKSGQYISKPSIKIDSFDSFDSKVLILPQNNIRA